MLIQGHFRKLAIEASELYVTFVLLVYSFFRYLLNRVKVAYIEFVSKTTWFRLYQRLVFIGIYSAVSSFIYQLFDYTFWIK